MYKLLRWIKQIVYKPIKVIKRHAGRVAFSLLILILFLLHVSKIVEWEFIKALEWQLYDTRLNIAMPKTLDSRIVIVDIDEQSLNEIGRWPWSRATLAQLITQLFDTYKIDILAFDVMFPEPDESSGLKKLQELAQGHLKEVKEFQEALVKLQDTLNYDAIFAESLRNRRVVLGYAFTSSDEPDVQSGQLPEPVISRDLVTQHQLGYSEANGFVANLPAFQAKAKAAGHFNSITDSDGIVRRVPLLYGYNGALYESLSLAVLRLALGVPSVELGMEIGPGQHAYLEFLQVGNRQIPVDKYIHALVPYRGKRDSFPYVPVVDVLYGRVQNLELLKNKIVLLGTTAQGLLDLRATPVDSIYPGVEIHANMIAGMLDNRIMQNPPYIAGWEILLITFIGLVMITLLPLLSPLLATLGTGLLLVSLMWLNLVIWHHFNLLLPLASPLLLILSLFLFNMSYGYFVTARHKRELTSLFGQYVPPTLVDEMSKNLGTHFSMVGESREMTVLFSDVRGFTTISEGLIPQELSELMREYLTPMTHVIHQHRGTIDKYIGDAIMAFWGAPLRDLHHARRAVDAAVEMLQRLEEMQPLFKSNGWPEIKIGIGINSGVMSVGNMGSEFRMAYTVLGDAVNLGARLEGLTKAYGVHIIVSETTKMAVPDYVYRELDCVRVKGKDQPVSIYEPIGLLSKVEEEIFAELVSYQKALDNYRNRQWSTAQQQFTELQQYSPHCKLYKIYAERIEHFLNHPPDEHWNGVYTFTTK